MIMIPKEELFAKYISVRNEEKRTERFGLIINSDAIEGGILLVGMNPSGDGDAMYEYRECKSDFWNPKHAMLGKYDSRCAYIDLLPVRSGLQRGINTEQANDTLRFYGKLLSHTRDYIEGLHPRLIIFANGAKGYWGLDKKSEWMNYRFEQLESPLVGKKKKWKLYRIVGILPSDVNRKAESTTLEGSLFLQYRQHKDARGKIVPKDEVITEQDINLIVEYIDPAWAKTLISKEDED